MNPSARPQTSRNRDRAIARLNSITTGTAIAAAVATAGFGALAAFTYSGTTDAATTDMAIGAAAPAETTAPAAAAVTNPSTTGVAVTPLQPTGAPVAAVKKKAKVTSGGSH